MLEEFTDKISQNILQEPVTPPLSPIYRPQGTHESETPDLAFDVPILSDPQSLTDVDLCNLEGTIFKEDVPTPIRNQPSEQDVASIDRAMRSEPTFLLDEQRSLKLELAVSDYDSLTTNEDLKRYGIFKVEEPLTPPMPVSIPKSVHFNEILEEMPVSSSSTLESDLNFILPLNLAFQKAAKSVTQEIEQETLLAADAIGRVEVPIVDFSISNPPWKIFQNTENHTIWSVQKSIIKTVSEPGFSVWLGQKNSESRLKWNPFPPNIAQMVFNEEHFADDSTWKLLLKAYEDEKIFDTSNLTWKTLFPKILRDDGDDEIEKVSFLGANSHDPSILATQRKIHMGLADNELITISAKKCSELPCARVVKTVVMLPWESDLATTARAASTYAPRKVVDCQAEFGLLMGETFSTENALDSFLALRGVKKQKLSNSEFKKFTKPDQTQLQTRKAEDQDDPIEYARKHCSPGRSINALPCPKPCVSTIPINVIVSSSLLKNRFWVKHLESHISGIKLIERDFAAYNTLSWLPKSVSRSPVSSSLDSEADIIVSSTTGIIFTTLQKIKQKSLPGHKAKPPSRERLMKVSRRYEKLIVLISDGSVDDCPTSLGANDCSALAEFMGFAAGLDSTTIIRFVAGGQNILLRWLNHSIIKYAAVDTKLLEEETHWELFLRRAGMNAFAAQCIGAAVKVPMGGIELQGQQFASHSGLAQFVNMTREQRINKFQDICGKTTLERVSDYLDAKWD